MGVCLGKRPVFWRGAVDVSFIYSFFLTGEVKYGDLNQRYLGLFFPSAKDIEGVSISSLSPSSPISIPPPLRRTDFSLFSPFSPPSVERKRGQ